MDSVAQKLHKSRLFSQLAAQTLVGLLEQAIQIDGQAGTPVNARPADVIIVLEGGLEMKNRDGRLLATVNADPTSHELGVLHAIPPGARLTMVRPSEILIMDGGALDDVLSQMHQTESVSSLDGKISDRVSQLIHTPPFDQMTLDQICRAADAMDMLQVNAGDEVIRYSDRGEKFFIIQSGEAEVWKTDPRTGHGAKVATLGPGASFGEEALLRGGLRSATVRMSKPGTLLTLSVDQFDELLASHFVQEIDADAAQSLLARGQAKLIDCRYPDEHEVWRIPGATLIPLDQVRAKAPELDKNDQYIVYCRTGRRSRAAAFLLRQFGLKSIVIRGGISAWPFAYEGQPVQQPAGIPPI